MNKKKTRKLTVYGQSNGYNYQEVPTIILKGKWLEEAGFNIGDKVHISVGSRQMKILCEGKNTY